LIIDDFSEPDADHLPGSLGLLDDASHFVRLDALRATP
jgi:hypothetical protein